MDVLGGIIGFEWDEWNTEHIKKHEVTPEEAEQPFFDERKVVGEDTNHSDAEDRYILIGKTKTERVLYIVFTLRKPRIRVISARDINKKREVNVYEKAA